MKTLILFLAASCLPALDLTEYDKQAHLMGGALLGYVSADILERKTNLSPFWRWFVSVGITTASGYLWEELVGYNDPEDAEAVAIGGVLGASGQVGVSFIFTNDKRGIEAAWRF